MPQSQIARHTDISLSTVSAVLEKLVNHPSYDFATEDLPPIPTIEEILAIRYLTGFLHDLSLVRTVCPQCRHQFVIVKHAINVRCVECLHPFTLKVDVRPVIEHTHREPIPNITDLHTDTDANDEWLDEE